MATTMNAWDALSAGLAECYVTLDGRRYKFMQAINLEASIEKKKMQVPVLGRVGRGNKGVSWSGSGKATFHYNSSIFGSCCIALRKAARICILISRLPMKTR